MSSHSCKCCEPGRVADWMRISYSLLGDWAVELSFWQYFACNTSDSHEEVVMDLERQLCQY